MNELINEKNLPLIEFDKDGNITNRCVEEILCNSEMKIDEKNCSVYRCALVWCDKPVFIYGSGTGVGEFKLGQTMYRGSNSVILTLTSNTEFLKYKNFTMLGRPEQKYRDILNKLMLNHLKKTANNIIDQIVDLEIGLKGDKNE